MTRRRQNRRKVEKFDPNVSNKPRNIETPLTFSMAIRRLIAVVKWKFSPKKWIGKRIFIYGKMRPVTGETFDYIFVKGLSHEIRKESRYLKKV